MSNDNDLPHSLNSNLSILDGALFHAPIPTLVLHGQEFKVVYANQALLDFWGKEKNIAGKNLIEILPEIHDQPFLGLLNGVLKTGEPYTSKESVAYIAKNGNLETVYCDYSYTAIRDKDGVITGVLVMAVDVTEQVKEKQAKEESNRLAEESNKSFLLALEAGQLGYYNVDLISGAIEGNSQFYANYGFPSDTNITRAQIYEAILPSYHEDIKLQLEEAFKNRSAYRAVYEIKCPDNSIQWIRATGFAKYNNAGDPVRMVGVTTNITAEKQMDEKQAILSAIVDSSDDAILSKTLEGIITSWNRAAQKMFGYSREEAVGKHISLLIPRDRLGEEEMIIGNITKGNRVDHFETVRVARDGTEIPVSLSVSPIKDSKGNIIGASKIARNMSDQIQAQKATERYTRQLETINSIGKSIAEDLDLDKILQKVTDVTTSLTGAKFGAFFYNVINSNGEALMLYTLSGAPREAFEKFGMPRNTAVFSHTFSGLGVLRVDDITKDPRYGKNAPHQGMPKGHLPVVSYLAVPVISKSGTVIGGLFFGHDEPGKFTVEHEDIVSAIASQAAVAIDNAKLYEEIKTLNAKKDEFIGMASHELKTPLTSISGYMQILERTQTEDKNKLFVRKTIQQVKKLASLVSDLLDVSKIEAGKLQLANEVFDVRAMVDEAVEMIRDSQNDFEITIDSTFDSLDICGDKLRLEQVMINLLTNAIKYSPKSDKVAVTLSHPENHVLIGVKDSGIGIPNDKLRNIFSRFYRVDGLSPHMSGLGIGLYISKEIVERHDGRIWVESEVGEGSTFWVSLPDKV